ncbi:hypothetical protein MSG28_007413 [Choristoneura fumiferana]|uniref:Uncharacterized protein n=1 Tax=Choristoneura fumiferana TaxID=7141 RepID=A0ACC0JWZ8_CHOFU|nr:hypothetical protein MSG28_007413 [Choristoneura fumiferana]
MGTLEERPLKQDSVPAKKSLREKIKYVKDNITIEPALACYVIPGALTRLATQNLNLDKACRVNLNYGDEVCDSLIARESNKYLKQELAVQELVASMEDESSDVCGFLKSFFDIKHVKDTLVVAFRNGPNNRRLKSSMILVCVVLVHGASYAMISKLAMQDLNLEKACVVKLRYGEEICRLLIKRKSNLTEYEREVQKIVSYIESWKSVSQTVVLAILLMFMGAWSDRTGDRKICILLPIIGDSLITAVTVSALITLQKDTVSVVTRRRQGDLRLKIILNLLVVAFIYGQSHAALFSISVFSKWWGFDDSTLCLISVVSQFVGSIYTSFVHTDFQMFLVPIVEILNATTFTSLRSMASKLVTSEESGKINSLFSLVEMLASLVFDPIYTSLYAATVKNFTGAVHLLSAAIAVPAVGVVLWFFVRHRQDLKRNQQQLHEHRLVCLSSEKSEI